MLAPDRIRVGDEDVSYREIHERFSQTPDGQTLGQNIRYKWYKPDDMSREKWVHLMGKDVCNLEHMRISYAMTRRFIHDCITEGQHISLPDQEDLLLTAVSHDWGEAVHGDKKYDLKTQADHDAEMETLRGHSLNWLDDDVPGLTDRICAAIHRTLGNGDPSLSEAFNVVERMGYVRTALQADRIAHATDNDELRERLQLLAANVVSHHTEVLLSKVAKFPSLRLFFHRRYIHISDALARVPSERSSLAKKYGVDDRPDIDENIQLARRIWHDRQALFNGREAA